MKPKFEFFELHRCHVWAIIVSTFQKWKTPSSGIKCSGTNFYLHVVGLKKIANAIHPPWKTGRSHGSGGSRSCAYPREVSTEGKPGTEGIPGDWFPFLGLPGVKSDMNCSGFRKVFFFWNLVGRIDSEVPKMGVQMCPANWWIPSAWNRSQVSTHNYKLFRNRHLPTLQHQVVKIVELERSSHTSEKIREVVCWGKPQPTLQNVLDFIIGITYLSYPNSLTTIWEYATKQSGLNAHLISLPKSLVVG